MKRRTNPANRPNGRTPEKSRSTDPPAPRPAIRLVPPEPPALVQEWRIGITPARTFRVRRDELGFFQTLILALAFPVARIENGKAVDRFQKI